jgi:hypothetical protein
MRKSFWLGLGVGLGLGALLAPNRGEVTRSKLARQLSTWAGWSRDDPKDELHEDTLDKTLADSFPTSDPPSSIPDPSPTSD